MVAIRSVICERDIAHPTDNEVRTYLRLLLGRTEFNASERNKRFLTYVVEETLGGRADRIKAYSIALAAFDRSEDFDPLIDPIVRIEASRLRRSLEHYYLTAGMSDRIRIDIPKGSYVATFAYRNHASSEPELIPTPSGPVSKATVSRPIIAFERQARKIWIPAMAALIVLAADIAVDHAWQHGNRGEPAEKVSMLSIAVLPFENTDGDRNRAFLARGLTYRLIVGLTQFEDVAVFGPEANLGGGSKDQALPRSSFTLFGSVQSEANIVRITALLSDSRTGQVLRSWNFESDSEKRNYSDIQSDVASQVILAIRQLCTGSVGPGGDVDTKNPTATAAPYDCRHPTYIAAK